MCVCVCVCFVSNVFTQGQSSLVLFTVTDCLHYTALCRFVLVENEREKQKKNKKIYPGNVIQENGKPECDVIQPYVFVVRFHAGVATSATQNSSVLHETKYTKKKMFARLLSTSARTAFP